MRSLASVAGRRAAHQPGSSPGQRQPGVVTLPPCMTHGHAATAGIKRQHTVHVHIGTLASNAPSCSTITSSSTYSNGQHQTGPAAVRLAAYLAPGSHTLLSRQQLLALLHQVAAEQQQVPPALADLVRIRLSSICTPCNPAEAASTVLVTKQLGICLSSVPECHSAYSSTAWGGTAWKSTAWSSTGWGSTAWSVSVPPLLRRVVACLDSPTGPCTIRAQGWSAFLGALAWHINSDRAASSKPCRTTAGTAGSQQASWQQQQWSGICSLAGRRAWIRAVLETAPAQALSTVSGSAGSRPAGQQGHNRSSHNNNHNQPSTQSLSNAYPHGDSARVQYKTAAQHIALDEAVQQLYHGMRAHERLHWPELRQCISMGVISLAPAAQLLAMVLALDQSYTGSGTAPPDSNSSPPMVSAAAAANSISTGEGQEASPAVAPHPVGACPTHPHSFGTAVKALALLWQWAAQAARSSKQPGQLVRNMLRDALQSAVTAYLGWSSSSEAAPVSTGSQEAVQDFSSNAASVTTGLEEAVQTSSPEAAQHVNRPMLEAGLLLLCCLLGYAPIMKVSIDAPLPEQLVKTIAQQLGGSEHQWTPSLLHNFAWAMQQLPDGGVGFLSNHPAVLAQFEKQAGLLAPFLDTEAAAQVAALQAQFGRCPPGGGQCDGHTKQTPHHTFTSDEEPVAAGALSERILEQVCSKDSAPNQAAAHAGGVDTLNLLQTTQVVAQQPTAQQQNPKQQLTQQQTAQAVAQQPALKQVTQPLIQQQHSTAADTAFIARQLTQHVQQVHQGLSLLDSLAAYAVEQHEPELLQLFGSVDDGSTGTMRPSQLAQLTTIPCDTMASHKSAPVVNDTAYGDTKGPLQVEDMSAPVVPDSAVRSTEGSLQVETRRDSSGNDLSSSAGTGNSMGGISVSFSDNGSMNRNSDSIDASIDSISSDSDSVSSSGRIADKLPTANSIASAVLAAVLRYSQEADVGTRALLHWKATCAAWLLLSIPSSQLSPSHTLVIVWSAGALKLDMGDAWVSQVLQLVQSALVQQASNGARTTLDTQLMVWAMAQLQQVGSASLLLQTCGAPSRQHELLQQLLTTHTHHTHSDNHNDSAAASGSTDGRDGVAAGQLGVGGTAANAWLAQASITDIAASLQCLVGVGAQPSVAWLVQVANTIDARLAELQPHPSIAEEARQAGQQGSKLAAPQGLHQGVVQGVQQAAITGTQHAMEGSATGGEAERGLVISMGDNSAGRAGSMHTVSSKAGPHQQEQQQEHNHHTNQQRQQGQEQQEQKQKTHQLQPQAQQQQQGQQQPGHGQLMELQAGRQAVNSLMQLAGVQDWKGWRQLSKLTQQHHLL